MRNSSITLLGYKACQSVNHSAVVRSPSVYQNSLDTKVSVKEVVFRGIKKVVILSVPKVPWSRKVR